MKHLFIFITFLFLSSASVAQQSAKVEIEKIKQNENTVEFTLASSKPFYFADNRYVLHFGKKEFTQYRQWKESGKGKIVFFIPLKDYNEIASGEQVWLMYGDKIMNVSGEKLDMESECNKLPNSCWWLGNLDKK